MKKRADSGRLAPWEEELIHWTDEDAQFWNFKDNFKDMKLDKIPRFKDPLLRPQLFIWKEGNEWLPIGKLKFACTEIVILLTPHGINAETWRTLHQIVFPKYDIFHE